MKKGTLTRFIIGNILFKIRKSNLTFNECLEIYTKKYKLSNLDKKFIHNVVLNTLRNINVNEQIIRSYIKKINKNDFSYFLILSAIEQICFLNIKSYAVINSICESYDF